MNNSQGLHNKHLQPKLKNIDIEKERLDFRKISHQSKDRKRRHNRTVFLIFLAILFAVPVGVVLGQNLKEFEQEVIKAKQAGATHVVITNNIPPALWEFDTPGDPYPAWYIYRPGLLKIFPPKEIQPYVNAKYAQKVASLLQERCRIVHKYGLKAAYITNEPEVLPEAFFIDHPELRGPRVDQENRSRTARFAPCVDRPEVLRLYREAMNQLLEKCPDVDLFSFLTDDSGSGFCWSAGLYPGKNGPSWCKNRPMAERVKGFLMALREGGLDAGKHIQIDIHGLKPRQWMYPAFRDPQHIAKQLPEGLAVNHYEGPDGKPMKIQWITGASRAFDPVTGIPQPFDFVRQLGNNPVPEDAPFVVSFTDSTKIDFRLGLYKAYKKSHPDNELESIQMLHDYATRMAGKNHASDLLDLWRSIDNAEKHLNDLDFGPVLTMGCILARWIDRPMVPFPDSLTEKEKAYYRPYLFQAKGEKQANNLIDIQGMRMFEGYGARLMVQRVIELTTDDLNHAEKMATQLGTDKDSPGADKWRLLGKRIAVVRSLVRTVDNMVGYQAVLDLAKNDGVKPNPNPVLGAKSSWKRTELLRIARDEIDNAAELRHLLLTTNEQLIKTASTPDQETIRMLGPELPDQIKKKIDIMNAHWEDYKRLFTRPNP